uniref:Uncharacterized protein n=1 Tax=Rhizophora mucronata TaxID=61149 RepID=A0A2P2QBH1_RHIMU
MNYFYHHILEELPDNTWPRFLLSLELVFVSVHLYMIVTFLPTTFPIF